MPVPVVDLLELVEVEHQHRQHVAVGCGPRRDGFETLLDDAAVGEAGQLVGARLVRGRLEAEQRLGVKARVGQREGGEAGESGGDRALLVGEAARLAIGDEQAAEQGLAVVRLHVSVLQAHAQERAAAEARAEAG